MKDNTQRLDIRRCSNEGVERLVSAILMQSISDWDVSIKSINKKGRNEKDMYELKQIIDFVQSDYFVCLTNASCPQRECVDKLIAKVFDKDIREELNNYSLINEKKWFDKKMINRSIIRTK